MRDAQVRDLLDAGAGVVEEQQQNPVAKREPTEGGQALEEPLNLVARDEPCVGQWRALGGDGGDLLADVKGLRAAPPRYSKNVRSAASRWLRVGMLLCRSCSMCRRNASTRSRLRSSS